MAGNTEHFVRTGDERKHQEETTAHGNQNIDSDPGGVPGDLPLQSKQKSQQDREQNPHEKIHPAHTFLFFHPDQYKKIARRITWSNPCDFLAI